MPAYQFGDLVLARIADPNGRHVKERPVLILSKNEDIETSQTVMVAAVSSSHIPDPLPPEFFELPWEPRRRVCTGLDRRSVVKCRWVAEIPISSIRRKQGFVPGRILIEIAKYYASQ